MPNTQIAISPAVQAEVRLRETPFPELWLISCESPRSGILVIHGRVSSFYLKQVAQTVVRGISGVYSLENQLSVARRHIAQRVAAE